jgi:hypothetical protein
VSIGRWGIEFIAIFVALPLLPAYIIADKGLIGLFVIQNGYDPTQGIFYPVFLPPFSANCL